MTGSETNQIKNMAVSLPKNHNKSPQIIKTMGQKLIISADLGFVFTSGGFPAITRWGLKYSHGNSKEYYKMLPEVHST